MSHHPEPETIVVSPEEFIALEQRISESNLSPADSALVIKSLHFMLWLQRSLVHAKLSIKKLQRLFKIASGSEKKGAKNKLQNKNQNAGMQTGVPATAPNPTQEEDTTSGHSESQHFNNAESTTHQADDSPKTKTGGRLSHTTYKNAIDVWLNHADYKVGDPCPTGCGGKLYAPQASVVIKIEGQSFSKEVRYYIQNLRCTLCGDRQFVKHNLPKEKYLSSFVAQLILHKYYLALPFHRIEDYQAAIDSPLPDATQWKLVNGGYLKLKPLFAAMEAIAVNASLFNYDDTRVKILSVIKENKENPDKKRTGQFTTVVLAGTIYGPLILYYSSTQHAGENMQALINRRDENAGAFITMSDALNSNTIKHKDITEANCMAHALVKFIDLEAVSPYDLSSPIDALSKVFDIDKKTTNMSPEERLLFHQTHSKPILDRFHKWMKEQIDQKKVEPNSHLGKVIKYCLKHWEKLTRFLTVAGCPVSNNAAERALKLIIRLRKTAMFHKTKYGALVASSLLSIIQSARENGVNPAHYLEDLLTNAEDVSKHPDKWLPWNYVANKDRYAKAA